MPPPLLIDTSAIDLDRVEFDRQRIYEILPHRHEFQLLDGVCYLNGPRQELIAYCDVRVDAWWVRAHIPGRPLMPGVLMLEAAAQTASVGVAVLDIRDFNSRGFLGFGGVDGCKFRDAVVPPARLYILCKGVENRARRIVSVTQGLVNGRIVFEATITGIAMG